MLVPNTPRSRLPGVVITGELRLPSVFTTGELIWTSGSRFTEFQEHTTIFKGYVILTAMIGFPGQGGQETPRTGL